MFGVAVGPFVGRIVDRLVPWYAALFSAVCQLLFAAIQTGGGGVNIAVVIIVCFGLDVFRQMQQVSLTTSVLSYVNQSVPVRELTNCIEYLRTLGLVSMPS
jgi:hypothetical protein